MMIVSQPGAFQTEFLTQHTEELWDGEIASGFQRHSGGRGKRGSTLCMVRGLALARLRLEGTNSALGRSMLQSPPCHRSRDQSLIKAKVFAFPSRKHQVELHY